MRDKTPESASFTNTSTHQEFLVHFNPSSLQYTVDNKLQNVRGQQHQQFVSESSAKLSMELVFDTTGTQTNVCAQTIQIARWMGAKTQIPPEVTFRWGVFEFTGIVDTYQEMIDFFSAAGVPLRSTVSLGMTRRRQIFARGKEEPRTRQVPRRPDRPTTRSMAARNGDENLRFPGPRPLTVDESPRLAPPVAFATGEPGGTPSSGEGPRGAGPSEGGAFREGASASLALLGSDSLGTSGEAAFGVGRAVGLRGDTSGPFFSAGASFSAGATFRATTGAEASGWTANRGAGGQVSAGVTATAGAFAGLRAGPPRDTEAFEAETFNEHVEAYTYETTGEGLFELGGRARVTGPSFGSTPSPRGRIYFEED